MIITPVDPTRYRGNPPPHSDRRGRALGGASRGRRFGLRSTPSGYICEACYSRAQAAVKARQAQLGDQGARE